MLLVALGVLTLLSVLAVAFVTNMSIEKKAAQNYVDGVKARLIAEAALARAIEEKRSEVVANGYSETQNLYAQGDFWFPLELTSDIIRPFDPANPVLDPYRPSMYGVMGQSYTGGVDRYKVKVIDAQAQFNLNNRVDDRLYKVLLRALGEAIAQEVAQYNIKITQAAQDRGLLDFQDLLYPVGNPFERAQYPRIDPAQGGGGGAASQIGVEAIVALRNAKEGQQFRSKSELLECMSRADYRLVRDFLTTKSWRDPKTLSPSGPTAFNALDQGGVYHLTRSATTSASASQADSTNELRAPINVNLAPKPLLVAMLAPLGGRRIYLHRGSANNFGSSSGYFRPVDDSSSYSGEVNGLKEPVFQGGAYSSDPTVAQAAYGSKRVLCYLPPLGYQQTTSTGASLKAAAGEIADAIILRRRDAPFKSFQEWDEFVEEELWPIINNRCDPRQAEYAPIILEFAGANTKRVPANVYSEIVPSGSSPGGVGFERWFKRSYVGLLKSAFNPNDRMSQRNPEQALFVEIDKGNIEVLQDQVFTGSTTTPSTDTETMPSQTCEWCFGSKGVVEIVALGELITNVGSDLLTEYGLPPQGGVPAGQTVQPSVHAQAKIRSVMRVFDEVTHTSQLDFARFGHQGVGQEAGNEQIVGFPHKDTEASYLNTGVTPSSFQRANIRSGPVDERYWMPLSAANSPTGNLYNPREVGGLIGDASERTASPSMGHLSLKVASPIVGGDAERFYDLPPGTINNWNNLAVNGVWPETLFELRQDYARVPTMLTAPGFYTDAELIGYGESTNPGSATPSIGLSKDRLVERASFFIAEVAGGQFLEGTPQLTPAPGQTRFRRPPTTTWGIPLLPTTDRRGTENFLRAGGRDVNNKWYNEFLTFDGFYISDHHNHRPDGISPTAAPYFPTYRAKFQEPKPVSARDVETTLDPLDAFYRRMGAPGTAGDQDWAQVTNIDATRGVISFWYKPDFDWYLDPVNRIIDNRFCAFFSATTVARPRVQSPAPQAGVASNNLPTHSLRGTQMYFTRMPQSGELRLVRMYYEVSGTPLGTTQFNPASDYLTEGPSLVNPHASSAAPRYSGGGMLDPQTYTAQYLTLAGYTKLYQQFFTLFFADVAANRVTTNYVPPPFYPYPPKELYLPQDQTDFASEGPRTNIDASLNRRNIGQARYDVVAPLGTAGINSQLLDLRRGRWYHLTVTWNDSGASGSTADRAQFYVNGNRLTTTTVIRGISAGASYDGYNWSNNPGRITPPTYDDPATLPPGSNTVTLTPQPDISIPKFVRLNTSRQSVVGVTPKTPSLRDELVIGGLIRRQSVLESVGVFKHVQGGQVAKLTANGTIDDFTVYRPQPGASSFVPVLNTSLANATIRDRYPVEGGEWCQWMPELDAAFDGSTQSLRILGVSFTAYLPHKRPNAPGSGSVVYDDGAAVAVQVYTAKRQGGSSTTDSGASLTDVVSHSEPYLWPRNATMPPPANPARVGSLRESNVPITGQTFDLLKDEMLFYRVVLVPGSDAQLPANTPKALTSPVLDSVTVTYQLPKSEVLLREQVFD